MADLVRAKTEKLERENERLKKELSEMSIDKQTQSSGKESSWSIFSSLNNPKEKEAIVQATQVGKTIAAREKQETPKGIKKMLGFGSAKKNKASTPKAAAAAAAANKPGEYGKGMNVVKDSKEDIEALMRVAKDGDYRKAEKLLEEGVPVDVVATWEFGETALMVAAKWGHTQCVELLLANRAIIDKRDDNGETALYKAAEWGRLDTVLALVQKGAGLDKAVKRTKYTPLMIAAKIGHAKICENLVREGASYKQLNAMGQDAIQCARDAGQEDAAKAIEKARDKRRKSKKIDPTVL